MPRSERAGYTAAARDMKSAIACFVGAAARFSDAHREEGPGSISLLITGDEEGPRSTVQEGAAPLIERGESLDACLVGEPTNPTTLGEMIKIGRRGSLNAVLTVTGEQGHSAYPHLADNPDPSPGAYVGCHRRDAAGRGHAALRAVDGGDHLGGCRQPGGQRHPGARHGDAQRPLQRPAHGRKHCRLAERPLCGRWRPLRYAHRVLGGGVRLPTRRSQPYRDCAVRRVTGREPELSTSGGTSDARFIKDVCPVCEFGMPGGTAHKVDESVTLADIEALTASTRKCSKIFLRKLPHAERARVGDVFVWGVSPGAFRPERAAVLRRHPPVRAVRSMLPPSSRRSMV